MYKLDEYTSEMRVIDDSCQIWHTQILNQKFKNLREGQFVRIRQATLTNHKNYNRVFGLKNHTNIMSLPYPCKFAEEMLFDDINETNRFEKEMLTSRLNSDQNTWKTPLPHPLIITQSKAASEDPLCLLAFLSKSSSDGLRCRFGVNAIVPDPTEDTKNTDCL